MYYIIGNNNKIPNYQVKTQNTILKYFTTKLHKFDHKQKYNNMILSIKLCG